MPQAKFRVKANNSYGTKGQIILLDVPEDGLTDRQKVMLDAYEEPEVVDKTDGEGEKTEKKLVTATPKK